MGVRMGTVPAALPDGEGVAAETPARDKIQAQPKQCTYCDLPPIVPARSHDTAIDSTSQRVKVLQLTLDAGVASPSVLLATSSLESGEARLPEPHTVRDEEAPEAKPRRGRRSGDGADADDAAGGRRGEDALPDAGPRNNESCKTQIT